MSDRETEGNWFIRFEFNAVLFSSDECLSKREADDTLARMRLVLPSSCNPRMVDVDDEP